MTSIKTWPLLATLGLSLAGTAAAAPAAYKIESDHTYPSFEADHMGISLWRGKFDKTSGSVTLDHAANSGSVDIVVDTASIDFGHAEMNEKAKSAEMFDVTKYPSAHYVGQLAGFVNGAPTRVTGTLTLHGVTQPVELKINSFKCIPHPYYKREACGADAFAVIQRDAFGIDLGKAYGFNMAVTLRIQVEAVKTE